MSYENQAIQDLIAKVEAALAEDVAVQERSYAESDTRLSVIEAELAAEREKREALERQLELQVVGQTMDEIHSFADGLVADGKLPPALKNQVATLLSVTANLEGDVKSYALGDAGEDADTAPYALLMDVLSALPVQGQFKRITKDSATAHTDGRGKTDVRRYASDFDAATELHERVKAVQKEKGISYLQAFEQVNREAINAQ